MAFLNETGLSTFKKKCDDAYLRIKGNGTVQQVSNSTSYTFGIKSTGSNVVVGQTQTTNAAYGPSIQMYDKNGTRCGEIMHSFRTGDTKASAIAFYAINAMADGTPKSGGFSIYRNYNVSSDTDGTTYWFSSKSNIKTAIGIYSGTSTPSNNTGRAGTGDIYIQY